MQLGAAPYTLKSQNAPTPPPAYMTGGSIYRGIKPAMTEMPLISPLLCMNIGGGNIVVERNFGIAKTDFITIL